MLYFLISFLMQVLKSALFLEVSKNKHNSYNSTAEVRWETCQAMQEMFISYSFFVLLDLHLFDILIATVLFFVKSPEDVLQGVSKLDYLLKVSVFQKYVNEANALDTESSEEQETQAKKVDDSIDSTALYPKFAETYPVNKSNYMP